MKTIGIIGGMSWQSTVIYYQQINEAVQHRLGGHHSAKIILYSVDFADIVARQHEGDWKGATEVLVRAAVSLRDGGAELIIIATNTMHRMADAIMEASGLPLVHIADATGDAITAGRLRRPLLLATKFTMEEEFYKGRLKDHHGLEPVVPSADDRMQVHRIIYDELCQGQVLPVSRKAMQEIMSRYDPVCDSVILGCTEITMLISQKDTSLPVFDTTQLHAEAAVVFALGGKDISL
ncbi:MAG: aspartate/glutamate racemase family protein [Alphaproteobacteria bacterium]|nr:aspartate/glutamate racemase family protein [Alphaproteobacteria bacterium]